MAQQLTSIEISRAVTLLKKGYSQQLGVVQGTVLKLVEAMEMIPRNRYRNKASRYRSEEKNYGS
jgi:hypothetical protein